MAFPITELLDEHACYEFLLRSPHFELSASLLARLCLKSYTRPLWCMVLGEKTVTQVRIFRLSATYSESLSPYAIATRMAAHTQHQGCSCWE